MQITSAKFLAYRSYSLFVKVVNISPKSDSIKIVTTVKKLTLHVFGFVALIIPTVNSESLTLDVYATAILNVDGRCLLSHPHCVQYDTFNPRSFKSTY